MNILKYKLTKKRPHAVLGKNQIYFLNYIFGSIGVSWAVYYCNIWELSTKYIYICSYRIPHETHGRSAHCHVVGVLQLLEGRDHSTHLHVVIILLFKSYCHESLDRNDFKLQVSRECTPEWFQRLESWEFGPEWFQKLVSFEFGRDDFKS